MQLDGTFEFEVYDDDAGLTFQKRWAKSPMPGRIRCCSSSTVSTWAVTSDTSAVGIREAALVFFRLQVGC